MSHPCNTNEDGPERSASSFSPPAVFTALHSWPRSRLESGSSETMWSWSFLSSDRSSGENIRISLSSSKSSSEALPLRPVVAMIFHHLCGCSADSSGGANHSLCNQARHFLARSLVQLRRVALWARPEILAAPIALIDFLVQLKPSTSYIARDFCCSEVLALATHREASKTKVLASSKLYFSCSAGSIFGTVSSRTKMSLKAT